MCFIQTVNTTWSARTKVRLYSKVSIDLIISNKIAEKLNIKFWTTIAIYKNGKEIAKEIGLDKKEDIYNLLKKGI